MGVHVARIPLTHCLSIRLSFPLFMEKIMSGMRKLIDVLRLSYSAGLSMSMANRTEPFSAINIEPLFQRKITYLAWL